MARVSIDALLKHQSWVRSLARSLVNDESRVDDLEQETWVRAMRRPPDAKGVRAWLRRVVRNLAIDQHRRAAARERREGSRKSRPPATPSDLLEQAELQRSIADLLVRLDESYRTVVLLRYMQGLKPRAIAVRLGIPVETVRTRLKRALKQMRMSLDSGHREWRAGMLALAGGTGALAKAATGAVVMGSSAKKITGIAAAIAIVLMGGLLWHSSRGGDGTTQQHADDRAGSGGPIAKGADTSAEHAPRDEEEHAPRDEEKLAPYATGIVVDPNEAPLAGVIVRGGFTKYSWVEPQSDSAIARTGPDGRFELARNPGRGRLTFVKEGYAPVALAHAPEMRVVLPPAQAVACVVTDMEGRAILKAGVSLMVRGGPHQRVFTDADGRVKIGTVPTGAHVSVGATALGYMLADTAKGYVAANVLPEQITLRLKRLGMIVDVVDAASGALVTESRVLFAVSEPERRVFQPVSPDVLNNGWFHRVPGQHYVPVYPDAKQEALAVEVHASAPGYRAVAEVVRWKATDQPPRHVMRLTRGTSTPALTGTVTGAPDAEVEVLIAKMARHPELARVAKLVAGTDGRFAVDGLPAGVYRVVARAAGRAPVAVDVALPAAPVRLHLGQPATLVVVTKVPGAWLHVQTPNAFFVRNERADDKGRAVFTGLPAGPLDVFPLKSAGVVPVKPELRSVRATVSAGRTTRLAVDVPVAKRFTLRVRGGAGATVWVSPVRGYSMYHSEGQGHKGTVDAAGTVTFELFEGRWAAEVKLGSAQQRFEFDADSRGETELPFREGEKLRGRIRDAATGKPVPGCTVQAIVGDRTVATAGAGDDGAFELAGLPARVKLTVSRAEGAAGHYPPAERMVELPAAALEIRLPRLDTAGAASARLRVLARDAADRKPVHYARVQVQGLFEGMWLDLGRYTTNAHGRCAAKVFAAERYRVSIYGDIISFAAKKLELDELTPIEVELERR